LGDFGELGLASVGVPANGVNLLLPSFIIVVRIVPYLCCEYIDVLQINFSVQQRS